jgi:hypothetical protein
MLATEREATCSLQAENSKNIERDDTGLKSQILKQY